MLYANHIRLGKDMQRRLSQATQDSKGTVDSKSKSKAISKNPKSIAGPEHLGSDGN